MDVYLARQPIFNSSENVVAYEILYRSGMVNHFLGEEGDMASSRAIMDAFQTFNLSELTDGKPAYINFTEGLIKEGVATLFPNDRLVVEVLETVEVDAEIIAGCRELKAKGYKIALDDFVCDPKYESIIDLADIIKIDFLSNTPAEVWEIVQKVRRNNLWLLAEKVETYAEFALAKEMGFVLFQGYFFSKPEIVTGSSLSPLKLNYLQLVNKLHGEEIEFDELAHIIQSDVALSYSLIKLINSAAFGFRTRITSVKQALVLLGQREIKKWVTLVALKGMQEDRPTELVRLSLVRAQFAELLAGRLPEARQADDFFLMGLFSLIDAILARPMPEILDGILLSTDIKQALLHDAGEMGQVYALIRAHEQADWDKSYSHAEDLRITCDLVGDAYLETLQKFSSLRAGI